MLVVIHECYLSISICRPRKDAYYDVEAEKLDLQKQEQTAKKSAGKQPYSKRVIIHDSFRNVSYPESEALLEKLEQGDAIFRPSSKVNINLDVIDHSQKLHSKIRGRAICVICNL